MSGQTYTASASKSVGKEHLRRLREGFGRVEECEDNVPHTEAALRLFEAFNERWPYVQRLCG